MSELEITKLCAEAMFDSLEWEQRLFDYNPLHDDAQAMALVKKMQLFIMPEHEGLAWHVSDKDDHVKYAVGSDSLNRAICECVANMQRSKP